MFLVDAKSICLFFIVTICRNCVISEANIGHSIGPGSIDDLMRSLLMMNSQHDSPTPPVQRSISQNGHRLNNGIVSKPPSTSEPHGGSPTYYVNNNFFLIASPCELNFNPVGDLKLESPNSSDKNSTIGLVPEAQKISNGFDNERIFNSNTSLTYESPSSPHSAAIANYDWQSPPDVNQEGDTNLMLQKWDMKMKHEHSSPPEESIRFTHVYIDGKKLDDVATTDDDKTSPKSLKDEISNLPPDDSAMQTEHVHSCVPDDDTECRPDSIVFTGGFKITYVEMQKIFDQMSHHPKHIKLIVPGGVASPLAGYFQKVDKSRHEEALQYGVCLFPNGMLVPIKPLMRILQLHCWLMQLSNAANGENANALHRSIKWSDMDCVLGLLRCFIKTNNVSVRLPSDKIVPYTQFEQHLRYVPKEILNHCNIEIGGFSIPYQLFTNALTLLNPDIIGSR